MVKGTWLCETECAYIYVDLSDDSDPQWDYNITIQFDNSVHSSDYRIDDFAIFESGVPHYAYPPEEGILENETAVYFHSRDGEFDIGGLLVVDNERQYMKFAGDTKAEIEAVKEIETYESLYSFLESYTS